jgi:hypothetical protein
MRRCVSDRTLWLVHEGEGQPEEQTHVRACPRCIARHDRLARDLDTLSSTLRALPAGAPRRHGASAVGWRRVAVAAMLAGVVAVAGVGAWHSRPSRPSVPARSSGAEVVPFLGDVSSALAPAGSTAPAAIEAAWLDDDLVAATVSSETGLEPFFSWDPTLDRDVNRDAETESDT